VTLRELPPVDRIVASLAEIDVPRALLVSETRRVIETMRAEIRAGQTVDPASAVDRVKRSLADLQKPSLRRVINATGVILHTNLGRAPIANFAPLEGYSNLEYDLAQGRRGKRDAHVSGFLDRLAGKPGIAVNNNAAAVLLTLHELARDGEAIVSRGELIEIGDGFRIPDIMETSGARLREVGTTNRTHIDDYRAAIGERTRLLMRVHPSNFHIEGFTAKPEMGELAALARERGLPLYEDLGSGCVADLTGYGMTEPRVSQSLDAGANLVSFSGDKLLGGPQAGLIVGDEELVARLRRNPLFRALRLDKIITQALEITLRHLIFERWDEIPALRMIRITPEEIRERAERLRDRVPGIELIEGRSVAGGGSTPEQSLPTWLLVVPGNAVEVERALRTGTPPVIGRIEDDRLVLDLRTVSPDEENQLVKCVAGLTIFRDKPTLT
jgi:L-seryl-tRNA(Ser) seleniumtransferase